MPGNNEWTRKKHIYKHTNQTHMAACLLLIRWCERDVSVFEYTREKEKKWACVRWRGSISATMMKWATFQFYRKTNDSVLFIYFHYFVVLIFHSFGKCMQKRGSEEKNESISRCMCNMAVHVPVSAEKEKQHCENSKNKPNCFFLFISLCVCLIPFRRGRVFHTSRKETEWVFKNSMMKNICFSQMSKHLKMRFEKYWSVFPRTLSLFF